MNEKNGSNEHNEPTLHSMDDYDTLKGEKKKIVWIVIVAGLLIGAIIVGANKYFGSAEDSIRVEETIGKVPLK